MTDRVAVCANVPFTVISSGEGDALEVGKSPRVCLVQTSTLLVILSEGGFTAEAEGSQYLYPQTLINVGTI